MDQSLLPARYLLQNRYKIEKVITHQNQSVVYQAVDTLAAPLTEICAIKEIIIPATSFTTALPIIERLEVKARNLARLRHPSFVKILDYFSHLYQLPIEKTLTPNDLLTESIRYYLVLEYVEGDTLERVLSQNSGPLAEKEVVEWAIQICEGLDYLHSQDYIYKDLNPTNLMLDKNHQIKLLASGFSKLTFEPKVRDIGGTEGYCPPEQYKRVFSISGDIYAFGATLYHLLTGNDPRLEIPFTFHERMPRSLNPTLSVEMEGIIIKALEFLSANRWQTTQEMRQALAQLR